MELKAEILPNRINVPLNTWSHSLKCAMRNKPGCVVSPDNPQWFYCGDNCPFANLSFAAIVKTAEDEGFTLDKTLKTPVRRLGSRKLKEYTDHGKRGMRYKAWKREQEGTTRQFSVVIDSGAITFSHTKYINGEIT